MFNAILEIHLLPQQVALMRPHRLSRGGGGEPLEIKTGSATAGQPGWAIEACRELLEDVQHAGNLQVIFSDLWARYDMIRLGEAEISNDDAISLARAQFLRHYPGADAATWPLRLARQGKQMLVAGMNPELMSAVTQMAAAKGRKLVSAQPLFAKVFDQHEKELAATDGWVLFDEPGMLIAAFVENGQLLSVHSLRSDAGEREKSAHLLLERQAALIARPATEVRIYSYSGAPLALREPWHVSRFRIIGRAGASPAARPN
jgi:hypothetical protein